MFQDFRRIILFLVGGGFIHFFLYFLFRTSEIIPLRTFRKLISFLWSGLFIFIAVILFLQRGPKNRFRVGCFPLFSSNEWMDVVIADGINGLLKKVEPSTCLTYPLDWSYDAVDTDSVSDISYLLSYGRRIGLDLIITERVDSLFKEGCRVFITFYNLETTGVLLERTELMVFDKWDDFFQRVVRKTLELSDFSIDSIPAVPLPCLEVWKNYGLGRYFQLRGDLAAAERIYRSGLAVDSTQLFLLKGLVSTLLDKGLRSQIEGKYVEDTYLEVSKLLHCALAVDSTGAQTCCLLGRLYIQRRWWNKAEKALRKAFRWEKDDPFLYLNLARLHSSRYKSYGFRNKEMLLKQALFLNPALERAWIELGEDYYFRGKSNEAERTYRKLLDVHPSSLDGLLALGKLYLLRNNVLKIIRVYEKVLEIEPDYADAYYNLGIAYYKDEREDEAIRLFERAIELNNHVDAHFYLGLIYEKRENREKAIEFFRKRIRLRRGVDDPFAEEARKNLYELLHSEG